ncbi:MAG: recombinase family protein [Oscillospiraceae bacterium]|nr:recombinase family protein [Oscillospiraceae bacterium]
MARKSRKTQQQTVAPAADLTIRAALYIRLSVEDKQTGSISIETQKLILNHFLESKPEIFVYDTYIDNGATGMNFHRPAFQQMLADIEAGFVNCVIVKDLSRLGRNSIDTGYYIEQYFTTHQVRFIAVTDQFDTADPNDIHAGIILPLKNMINEAYAIDIGRKIKAQQRQAMKDGEYIGARSPYGYLKAPDNCHQLIIDPQTAPVVQQMFQWASEGAGLNTIARRLNEAGIVSVSVYKQQIGQITHENLIGNGKWQTRTVNKILRCETYTGDLVQGHSKSIDHKQVRAGADNLIAVQNTHEAIVSRELFAQVQSILDATAGKCRSRAVNAYTPNLLKGKVFCAHCGTALHRQRNSRKKSDDVYIYHCLTNSRVAKDSCLGVTIREDKLLPVLLDIMQTQMETTLGQYALLLADDEQREKKRQAVSTKLGVCRQDIAQYRSRIRGLYENLVQGVISSEEYFSFKKQYEAKISDAENELNLLERNSKTIELQQKRQKGLSNNLCDIRKKPELTAALIDRLIERIEVSHDKQISVRFRFQSEFEEYGERNRPCRHI